MCLLVFVSAPQSCVWVFRVHILFPAESKLSSKSLRCVDGGHATKRYSEDCHCQNKLLVKCLSLLASSQPFIICTFQKHPSVSECFTRNTPPPNSYGDACQSSFFPLKKYEAITPLKPQNNAMLNWFGIVFFFSFSEGGIASKQIF